MAGLDLHISGTLGPVSSMLELVVADQTYCT